MIGFLTGLLALATLVQAQTHIEMTAKDLKKDGSVLRGRGAVEAKADQCMMRADEGTLNRETGEIDLRGHVHVVLPPRTDHTVFRYDSHALVTGKAVDVFADHIHVKNMLLQGSGHVQVRAAEGDLQADEIVMYMNTADAQLHGTVPAQGLHRGLKDFPPEVIK